MNKDYIKESFLSDIKAGFITAIVALPLAIAFAIASGVSPIMGIYTAIIAGILGSAFGGSNYSITGPTGAMAVIILSTVNQYGVEGLLLAGLMAGILQIIFGLIKIGKVVKYMPIPVITGFTAGIGGIILIGQFSNFFGLNLSSKTSIIETLKDIILNLNKINSIAISIALITILILIFLPKKLSKYKYIKNIPPSIIALVLSALVVYIFNLNIPAVGDIPRTLPTFSLLKINFNLIKTILPISFTIALLGSIEALLCAVVCDGMTNTKHNSNKELIGQGIANTVLPLFGAIPATAAIARSAVNIREGAKTKMAGIYHAIILLIIILFFSPFAKYIPKAFLAGLLIVISIRMINIKEIKSIIKTGKYEMVVLFTTLVLTILTDLVFAVQIGMILAIFLLFIRLTQITNIKNMEEYDSNGEINTKINNHPKLKNKIALYTIHGPFFFGTMNVFEQKITEHVHAKKPIIILRMKHVPFIDGSGLIQLLNFLETRKKSNSIVLFTEFWPNVEKELFNNKEFNENINKKHIFKSVNDALNYAEKYLL